MGATGPVLPVASPKQLSPSPPPAPYGKFGVSASVGLVPEAPDRPFPEGIELPEKDRPILQAAIAAAATHLVTGDITHVGPYIGRSVAGLQIQTPGDYLRQRDHLRR